MTAGSEIQIFVEALARSRTVGWKTVLVGRKKVPGPGGCKITTAPTICKINTMQPAAMRCVSKPKANCTTMYPTKVLTMVMPFLGLSGTGSCPAEWRAVVASTFCWCSSVHVARNRGHSSGENTSNRPCKVTPNNAKMGRGDSEKRNVWKHTRATFRPWSSEKAERFPSFAY